MINRPGQIKEGTNTMTALNLADRGALPAWFWVISGLGLVWNVYGVYQYAGSFSATTDQLVAAGMTPAQAALTLRPMKERGA